MSDPPGSRRTTIEDVARAADVSIGTVSRVLNDRDGVHPRTRATVRSAIARLGYRPDRAARQLSLRGARRIGLSVGLGSRRLTPYFMLLFERLNERLGARGFRVEEIPTRADGLPEHLPDAVVLVAAQDDDPRPAHLAAEGIPYALVGRADAGGWVAPDDRDGGRQATRHLLGLGHRRLLHVTGSFRGQVFFDRWQGFADAFAEVGIEPDPALRLTCDGDALGAYRAVRRALASGLAFEAVFAATDEMAIGVIAALEDAGKRVPDDVSVVGFDDLPEVGDRLTTIRQDIDGIADVAADLIQEAIAGEPARNELVPVRLVTRETTVRRR